MIPFLLIFPTLLASYMLTLYYLKEPITLSNIALVSLLFTAGYIIGYIL
jgi:hypothetical protein